MLARNQKSLRSLTDPDYEQILLIDEEGIGVEAANARLADVEIEGAYAWVLDDDDLCIEPTLIDRLKATIASAAEPPAAIVLRMDHGVLGVLPPIATWKQTPREGHIGSSAIVTRRDIWYQYRDRWRSGRYAADYDFVSAILRNEPDVIWIDVIGSAVQRISRGAAEGV